MRSSGKCLLSLARKCVPCGVRQTNLQTRENLLSKPRLASLHKGAYTISCLRDTKKTTCDEEVIFGFFLKRHFGLNETDRCFCRVTTTTLHLLYGYRAVHKKRKKNDGELLARHRGVTRSGVARSLVQA